MKFLVRVGVWRPTGTKSGVTFGRDLLTHLIFDLLVLLYSGPRARPLPFLADYLGTQVII